MLSQSLLAVEHGTTRVELDRDRHRQQERRNREHAEGCDYQVHRSLDPAHGGRRRKTDIAAAAQLMDIEMLRQQLPQVSLELDGHRPMETAVNRVSHLTRSLA